MVELGKLDEPAHRAEDALDRVAIRESADIGHDLVGADNDKCMFEPAVHNIEHAQAVVVGQVVVLEFVLDQLTEQRKVPR